MEIIVQKYELEQDGKTYSITTQVTNGKLRLICEETNTEYPLAYFAEFTLTDLAQLSSAFASISNISEAVDIFTNIFNNQKVTIEMQGEYIYLKVEIKKEGLEEYFSLLLNLYDPKTANTQVVSFPQVITNQFSSQSISYGNEASTQGIPYQFVDGNGANASEQLTNQYLSYITNNQGSDNGQIIYSTTNTSQKQYTEIPNQTQTTGNMQYNISGNNYSYENVKTTKTKRKRLDKLTLSLRAQYPPQSPVETLSPTKQEKEQYVEPEPIIQQKVVETVTTTNINNEELENLRNENNRLRQEIIRLKNQILINNQEISNLKLKNTSILTAAKNGNNSQEIIILKQEIEKYINEIKLLNEELGEFDEYKRIKEEEINSLKIQIEELLINQKKMEEFRIQKQREIDELRAFIDDLLKKQKIDDSQYQSILKENQKREVNMEDQMLTIQDTRLEIVKGDIIQDVKELEMLSRKISKNNRKIIFNLLYKATIDSDKAEKFHKKCDSAKSTLVLVKSGNGKRFGGYTSRDWKGDSVEKKDDNAFVFSLDKMRIYEIIPGEDAIGCYPKYGPVFLGCQIRIYDEFFSKGGTTFEKGLNYSTQEDYELTGGLKKFDIKEIEVYSIELK